MVGNWIRRAEIGKTDWFCPDCFSEWSDWKRHDECPYCHGGPPTPVDQAKFPETPDEFFEAAARVFGPTDDPKLAGWILPDGTMLAFSTSGALRDRDHREIAELFGGQQQGWEAIKAFMDMGAIRVGQGSVTLSKNPTTEQKDALWIYFQSHSRAGYGLNLETLPPLGTLNMEFPAGTTGAEIVGILEEEMGLASGPTRRRASVRKSAQEDAYANAVEAGDTATMQRLVDEAAKKAGYNVGPVWHGTRNPFTQFDISRARSTGFSRIGFWFTDTPGAAAEYGTRAMKVFLDVREPRTFATWGDFAGFAREDDGEELRQRLLGENTDSVKIRGEVDGIEQNITAVLDPRQIKSADPVTKDDSGQVIPLSKRFDFSNPDIRY